MQCECGSKSFIHHYGKHNDLADTSLVIDGETVAEHEGYALEIAGVCGGDDTQLTVCIKCGRIQNFVPLSDEEAVNLFNPVEEF